MKLKSNSVMIRFIDVRKDWMYKDKDQVYRDLVLIRSP